VKGAQGQESVETCNRDQSDSNGKLDFGGRCMVGGLKCVAHNPVYDHDSDYRREEETAHQSHCEVPPAVAGMAIHPPGLSCIQPDDSGQSHSSTGYH